MSTDFQVIMIMKVSNLIATVPSLIGSFIVCYYCLEGISANAVTRLIFILAVSDFFYSLTNLSTILDYSEDSFACMVEAVSRQFFFGLAVWIAASIAVFHYRMFNLDPGFKKFQFVKASVISGTLVSLILSLRYYIFFLFAPMLNRSF